MQARTYIYGISFLVFLMKQEIAYSGTDSTGTRVICSAAYHYGFIIAHRPSIVPLQKKHVKAFELSIAKQTSGNKVWQQLYNFPRIGIKYFYYDLGNREQLGTGHAVMPFIDFSLSNNENFGMHYNFGWGVGYVEKTFDLESNYKNLAIGSHWNAFFNTGFEMEIRAVKNTFITTGVCFSHFSNGSMTMPNLGINLTSVKAGIIQKIGSGNQLHKNALPDFLPHYRRSVYLAASLKENYPVLGPEYFVLVLSASGLKQFTRKSAAGFAADVHYDEAIADKLKEDSADAGAFSYKVRGGISAAYELIFSDFSMMFQMGGYLYRRTTSDGLLYHRLGFRYNFHRNYFGCFNLKSHWAKADFFEWGIGVKF